MRVEFYGIPRQRAGTACTTIDFNQTSVSLSAVLRVLGQRFPEFGRTCLRDGKLQDGFVVNVDGERFVGDPETAVDCSQAVLVMSSDAGG